MTRPTHYPVFSECSSRKRRTSRPPIKNMARDFAIVITLMLVLAGLLNLVLEGGYFFNLRYCLAIGLSITISSHFLMQWGSADNLNWQTSLAAILLGTAIGIVIVVACAAHGDFFPVNNQCPGDFSLGLCYSPPHIPFRFPAEIRNTVGGVSESLRKVFES